MRGGAIDEGGIFFDKMDRDMDNGWQMGRQYVAAPDTIMRGQIVASRLLIAIESGNTAMIQAMAGYILSRIPDTVRVNIDTTGDMVNTEIVRSGH